MANLRTLLTLSCLLLATSCYADTPNVVFILADDLGYGDIRCFGGDRCQIETPHFDRLAAEGMKLTDAHATASVCVPSRIAIMTGRYAWRFQRPRRSGPWGFINTQLPLDQFTVARLLKGRGYRTGYVGKWHLGTTMQTTDGENQGPTNVDYDKPLLTGPPQFGFDESFILPGSLDMYPYAYVRNNHWIGNVTASKGWSAFNRIGPAAEDFDDTLVLDTFCREADRFLREGKRDEPFFLYLALTSPHTPLSPRKAFQGKSKLGPYGDFVMETDDCVGRVLQTLDELGIANDTLVIATSDHGPASYAGRNRVSTYAQNKELQKDGHYSAGIFRGYKFSVYEGGFRVPFVARWPKTIPPGSVCDQLVSLGDLMATLADITEFEVAPDQAPDSHSFLPLLKDPAANSSRDSMILQATRAMAIRKDQWKLAFCPGSGSDGRWGNLPMREEAWEKAAAKNPVDRPRTRSDLLDPAFVQLFRLDRDPGESRNLAADNDSEIPLLNELFVDLVRSGRSTPGPKLTNENKNVRAFSSVPEFVWNKPRKTIRVVVWDERQEKQKAAYENYLGNTISEHLKSRQGLEVRSVALDEAGKGITDEILDSCDVLVWWGHVRQDEITPQDAKRIVDRIRNGKLDLIALHSAHWSTPFMEAMNEITREEARRRYEPLAGKRPIEYEFVPPPGRTPPAEDSLVTPAYYAWQRGRKVSKVRVDLPNCCFPAYLSDGKPSTLHVESLGHPIARGLPAQLQIASTEMYGEPFHVPEPDEVVFRETWESGRWFRSGAVWNLGRGKVFYFRPGHETYPVYKAKWPLKIVENAVRWLGQ